MGRYDVTNTKDAEIYLQTLLCPISHLLRRSNSIIKSGNNRVVPIRTKYRENS